MSMPLIETNEFTIDFDSGNKVLEITLRGHWTDASLQRYNAGIRQAVHDIMGRHCRRGEQLVLIDVTQFAVQSPGVLEGLSKAAVDKATAGRRTALVLSSALLMMQAKRATPHYEIFEDRSHALAWLLNDK